MKNTLADLNNILFEEIERLNDKDLNKEDLKLEIERARAMAQTAQQIVNAGSLVLKAQEMMAEHHSSKLVNIPQYLLSENQKNEKM